MTKEDRKILVEICKVIQALVGSQLNQNRSARAVARALDARFPGIMQEFQQESQKWDELQSVAECGMQAKIVGIIERLS